MQLDEIAAVLERKRELHPELARGLTWPGFERICGREGVSIAFQSLPREAQLVPFMGSWTIILNKNLPFRRHTYRGAHELGHLWLHHDLQHERTEHVYNMDVRWEADPREDDAEHFAQLILMGPKRSSPWIPDTRPDPAPPADPRRESQLQFAKRMARLEARKYR
jgi:hypothetical protein